MVLLVGCLVGCGEPTGERIDAATTCDPARTVQCVVGPVRAQACAGEPIRAGSFCDDVFACVTDEAAAQALTEVAPGFACVPGPGELAMCDAGEYSCHWLNPGTIDAADFAAICAVTLLPTPPAQVMCVVYV
ncbi:MAG TPA: hypothetical protein VNM90_19165 [Haliangium sp.]|nr:hypothetical protein [Haliangium sp.]